MNNKMVLLLILASSTNVSAEIYKCVDDSGKVDYRSSPCLAGFDAEWAKQTEAEKQEQAELERQKRYQEQQKALEKKQQEIRRTTETEHAVHDVSEMLWTETNIYPVEVKAGIRNYLEMTLRDPDSMKDFKWLSLQTDGTNFRAYVFYRAKNGYGAYGISRMRFTTDKDGHVFDVKDLGD